MNEFAFSPPLPALTSATGWRRLLIRDLLLPCLIGVHSHEQDHPQRVRLTLDLYVLEDGPLLDDELAQVVCYEAVLKRVRAVVASGHVGLVETLAERVAGCCLEEARISQVRVRIEKLDVFADTGSVGVEIERRRA